MTKLQRKLYDFARRKFGKIRPASGLHWKECYIEEGGKLYFWFNKKSSTTALICFDYSKESIEA